RPRSAGRAAHTWPSAIAFHYPYLLDRLYGSEHRCQVAYPSCADERPLPASGRKAPTPMPADITCQQHPPRPLAARPGRPILRAMSLVIAEKPLPAVSGTPFKIVSDLKPAGDQPQAIRELTAGLQKGERDQVLLGVTGSGKTFTMAQVIQNLQRPTLILAPNKTLAAQLYGEMKSFFPENSIEYFVSYYDYYQPEAYVPRTDTYIEKESSINEQIDRMRHSATRSLFERRDVVIVASGSCIYGIGSPETYSTMTVTLKVGQTVNRAELLRRLVEIQYKRNDAAFQRGTFRARGDSLELFPAHLEDRAWRLSLFGD